MKKNLFFLMLCGLVVINACNKNSTNTPSLPPPTPPQPIEPTQPPPANWPSEEITTFADNVFHNEWVAKNFQAPQFQEQTLPLSGATVNVSVDASKEITKIAPGVFGQNLPSYVGDVLYVEPDKFIERINSLNVGLIRLGGSLADYYFWNTDQNNRLADIPDSLFTSQEEQFFKYSYWHGMNNHSLRGKHDRLDLADYYQVMQRTNNNGMITVNYAYARYGLSDKPVEKAANLAADWVRHDNGRTKYWEIGNENYGSWEKGYRINTANNKDGQPEYISGALYAQHCKVFIDSMRKAASEKGVQVKIGVVLIEEEQKPGVWLYHNSVAAGTWNRDVLSAMSSGTAPDYYILHNYMFNPTSERSYESIVDGAQTKTARMMAYINSDQLKYTGKILPIALTEYNLYSAGASAGGFGQQVSFVNGMHTSILIGQFLKSGGAVATRWNIASKWYDNGTDNGLLDAGDEPGGTKWNPRPVYYYMYFFQKMSGDKLVSAASDNASVLAYGSKFSSGEVGVALINKSRSAVKVYMNIANANNAFKRMYWYTLEGGTDNGDFSRKVYVNTEGPTVTSSGGPQNYQTLKANSSPIGSRFIVDIPARGGTFLVAGK